MPDPVLIIPGTQATTLRDHLGTVVYNAVSVGVPLIPKSLGGYPRAQWVDLMSLEYRSGDLHPTRTSLLPGVSITPSFVVQSPYALFPKYYEEWAYDWRQDMRWNADQLLTLLRSRRQQGEPRATLIGHSQGGILIVLASKHAAAGEFAQLVSRVILVGAPLAGTMRATEALVFGNTSLGKNDQLLALAMARTWPALYQMLPAWPCVTDSAGHPLPTSKQLLSSDGWPGGVSEDMLERARAVQALLLNPFDNFGPGIAVTTIMGTNQTTGNRLVRKGDTFEKIVMEKKTGDTLVPDAETIAWGGNSFRYTVIPFAGQTRPHAELCSDYAVAAYIVSQVNAPAPNP